MEADHNGQKELERHYKNGQKEGLSTYWHKNGQKFLEGHYENNEPIGTWTIWNEEGEKESVDAKKIKESYSVFL